MFPVKEEHVYFERERAACLLWPCSQPAGLASAVARKLSNQLSTRLNTKSCLSPLSRVHQIVHKVGSMSDMELACTRVFQSTTWRPPILSKKPCRSTLVSALTSAWKTVSVFYLKESNSDSVLTDAVYSHCLQQPCSHLSSQGRYPTKNIQPDHLIQWCAATEEHSCCTKNPMHPSTLRKNKTRKANSSGRYCIIYIHTLTMQTGILLAWLTRSCSCTCLYQSKNNQCWFIILIKSLGLLKKN